jgi:hypothetical protein
MKTTLRWTLFGIGMSAAMSAWASEAETSATAGSSRFDRNGTAAATARYDGRVGFARTDTSSGRLSRARGVAVGVDEDGLSLSVSHAIAPRNGPAVATNFSVTIDRDGDVARNTSLVIARSPIERSVTAGGQTGTGRVVPHASGFATGRTDPFGRVQSTSRSDVRRAGLPVGPPCDFQRFRHR